LDIWPLAGQGSLRKRISRLCTALYYTPDGETKSREKQKVLLQRTARAAGCGSPLGLPLRKTGRYDMMHKKRPVLFWAKRLKQTSHERGGQGVNPVLWIAVAAALLCAATAVYFGTRKKK